MVRGEQAIFREFHSLKESGTQRWIAVPHSAKSSGHTRPHGGAWVVDHLLEQRSEPSDILSVKDDEILDGARSPPACRVDSVRMDVAVVVRLTVSCVLEPRFLGRIGMLSRQPSKHLNRVIGKGLLYASEQICHRGSELLTRLAERLAAEVDL